MAEPIVSNAADEKQLGEAQQKGTLSKMSEKNAIKALLGIKEFRRFIYEYVTLCDRISADNSGSWTYFREGERNICQKIKAKLIEADADGVLLMMREGKVDFK